MLSFTAPKVDEKQLQDELSTMTDEEKWALQKDLYGVEREPPQPLTAGMRDDLLDEMEAVIEETRLKEAYVLAMNKCPQIAQDRNFRLEFLEATQYDAKLAAVRMVQYWETKKELFGEGALFCSPKIAISDLDEDAQSSLYDSVFMLLPSRDKHGRRIIFSTRQAWKFASVNSMRKALWYIMEALREDPTSRSKGVVVIAYDVGKTFDMASSSRKLDMGAARLARAVPTRFVAMHHITDSTILRMIWPFVMFVLGRGYRQRVVDHNHEAPEWLKGFEHYGISTEDIPQAMGGSLEFNFRAWLNERKDAGR